MLALLLSVRGSGIVRSATTNYLVFFNTEEYYEKRI